MSDYPGADAVIWPFTQGETRMAKPSKPVVSKASDEPPVTQQHRLITAQVAQFLQGGGEIQQIPRGVSGQPKLGGPSLKPSGT